MGMSLAHIEFDRRIFLFRLALQVVGLAVFALSVYWWLAYGVAREMTDLSSKASTIFEALFTPAENHKGQSALEMSPPWHYLLTAISGAIGALGCLLLARRTTRILDWALAAGIALHALCRFLVVSLDWASAIWTLALLGLAAALIVRPPILFEELYQPHHC